MNDATDLDRCFAQLAADDMAARGLFERGRVAAEAAGDEAAAWLCAAGSLLAIAIEFADFRGLARCSGRFVRGQHLQPTLPRAIDRHRIDAALLALPQLDHGFAPDTPEVEAAARRLLQALRDDPDIAADERVLFGKMLFDHHSLQEQSVAAQRVAALVNEHLRTAAVSPAWVGRWWMVLWMALDYWGEAAQAQEAERQVRAQVEVHDLPVQRFGLAIGGLTAAMKVGDTAAADRHFAEIDQLRSRVRPGLVPRGLQAQVTLLTQRGDFRAALDRSELLLALCADAEVPQRDQGVYLERQAYCLAGLRRFDEAVAVLEGMRAHQAGSQGALLEAIIAMMAAVRALETGREDAEERAIAAVRQAAALDFQRFLLPMPVWAGRVAEIAWDAGVETAFLRSAIHERRLQPTHPLREAWPWRLRVYTLGELLMLRDDLELRTSGKAQRKPLELLALLAAQGGRPIDSEAVIDQLWPSLEANAPRASLDMTVSRLRKLLDLPEAIVVADGMLSLNRACVWTDVAAFEAASDAAARPDEDAALAASRAVALYRDRLLGSEDLQGLMAAARQRLSLRFIRVVVDHGARLEAAGDWTAAQRLYERGLIQDTLAEPIYRALMRTHLQRGERAEAMRTFRRCRELLTAVLGVEPSAETLMLAERARSA